MGRRGATTEAKYKPKDPKRVHGKAVGAQWFRGADPMRDDCATGVLLLCVVVAACRFTLLVVDTEVLCSVLQRRRIGQFVVVGLQTGGKCSGGRPRVLFGRGPTYVVDKTRVSLLCVVAFSLCHGFCAMLRSSLDFLTEERATVYRHPTMLFLIHCAALLHVPIGACSWIFRILYRRG